MQPIRLIHRIQTYDTTDILFAKRPRFLFDIRYTNDMFTHGTGQIPNLHDLHDLEMSAGGICIDTVLARMLSPIGMNLCATVLTQHRRTASARSVHR